MKTKSILLFLALLGGAAAMFGQATVVVGQPVMLKATVTAGTPPLTYKWQKSGAVLPSTSDTVSITSAAASDAGSYIVTVSNNAGATTSPAVTLAVGAALPVISKNPVSQSVTAGATVTFTMGGDNIQSVQWQKNGVPIPGANNNTFVLPNVQLGDAAVYVVVATNLTGTSVTSAPATLTVTQVIPAGASITITAGKLGP